VTGQPDHLTDEAGAVLMESIDERVYFVRSKRWIAYPKAVEILGHLNALLKYPRTTRMPSLAVYGDSGMGKSMLIEKFKDDYALSASDRPDGQKTKVLVMEMAGRPNERRLYAQILAVVGAPQNPRATIVELERTAVRLLGDLGAQVLVLDEIHNVLAASWREQRVVFNTLRYLSNELKLSLVCFASRRRGKRSMAMCNWLVASMRFPCRDGRRTKILSNWCWRSSATCR
jgi:Bacterial TniB protein